MKKLLCIVPLAGKGSRFEALSYYHKALLPYKNKTILQHLIENVKKNYKGDVEFVFVVNYKQDKIIEELEKLEIGDYHIITQEILDGPLRAIENAIADITVPESVLEDYNILIHLGDMISYDVIFDEDFLSFNFVNDFSRWCMVDDDLVFYDKPSVRPNTNKALSGLYYFTNYKLFSKCVFDVFEKEKPLRNDEYQFSQMLTRYTKKKKMELQQVKIVDCGVINDYLEMCGFNLSRIKNSIHIDSEMLVKNGPANKIVREYYHGLFLKDNLGFNVPFLSLFVNREEARIEQKRIINKSLDYAFVFKDKPLEYFENLFSYLIQLLQLMRSKDFDENSVNEIKKIMLDREIENEKIEKMLYLLEPKSCASHGDFHLGNLFEVGDEIYMVDFSGRFFSHVAYDLAKLMHGIIYNYHLIKYNLYKIDNGVVTFYNEHMIDRIKLFIDILDRREHYKIIQQAKIICMILFKTMQPLHKEEEHKKIFEAIHKTLLKEITKNDYSLNIIKEMEL